MGLLASGVLAAGSYFSVKDSEAEDNEAGLCGGGSHVAGAAQALTSSTSSLVHFAWMLVL